MITYMNHIHRLQADLAAANARIAAMEAVAQEFKEILDMDKFKGVDSYTGDRKDWIATGDVNRYLESIMSAGL